MASILISVFLYFLFVHPFLFGARYRVKLVNRACWKYDIERRVWWFWESVSYADTLEEAQEKVLQLSSNGSVCAKFNRKGVRIDG